MSDYIRAIKDSGIIQKLRSSLSDADKSAFDEHVEASIKEYNSMWLELNPAINAYQEKVESNVDKSEGEQRRDDESDNR